MILSNTLKTSKEDFLNLANYSNPEYMDCDLIRVNGEYSINTVSFGFDVEVARQVNELKKKCPQKVLFHMPYRPW